MNRTIIISSEFMGRGDDDLGRRIMGSFLRKIGGEANRPVTIVFYNSGVRLLAEGSPVLDGIDVLVDAGVDLMACGTCVNHYGLADKMERGVISDMQTIIAALMNSDSVITI